MSDRRSIVLALFVGALLSACAPGMELGTAEAPRAAADLWADGHRALYLEEWDAAETSFVTLARDFPETAYGREALFFAALVRLDPGNPAWSPDTAATRFERYLDEHEDETEVAPPRAPEARSALALADQFRRPPAARIEPLRPIVRTVTIDQELPDTDEELREEVQQLRQRVAERDQTIQQQQAEIERIRRALVPDD